ncbi:MAG: protein kinase [Myxococcota bacterium]|nr:protein kinase [Myxococcota bacterium]
MTTAAQTSPPRLLGRYVLHGEIASGGMATVHFGRLIGAAGFVRSVAIKRLHPQYAKDPDFVAMFLDEARLAARISHPNVVPTLDIVSQDDELFLIMDYVPGVSLSRLIRALTKQGERMPVRIAAATVAGVLHGLHAAHEAKSESGERLDIVHRDVSPQNVLVGTDGIARVHDFGVAKAAGRVQSTREGQLKGKLAYMAPEQVTTGVVTQRTDVYAAGVVLWEVLTGRRLFAGENEAKVLALVLDGHVDAPSHLVAGLAEAFDPIVARALNRDPNARYANAREMAMDIADIAGLATPTEVAQWVEEVASEELRDRAQRIDEMARDAGPGTYLAAAGPPRLVGAADAVTAPTAGGRHILAEAAAGADPSPGAHRSPAANPSSQDLSMVNTEPPPRRTFKSAAGPVPLMLAAGALCATLLALHSWPSGVSEPTPTTHGVLSPTAAGATLAAPFVTPDGRHLAMRAPQSLPSPTPPSVTAVVTATAPSGSAASLVPAAPAEWKDGPPSTGGARAPAALTNVPRAAATVDCTPPYTTDAKGHIHFKAACL